MALAVSGIAQARLDVLAGEVGKIHDNLLLGHAGGKIVQDIVDGDPHAADARFTMDFPGRISRGGQRELGQIQCGRLFQVGDGFFDRFTLRSGAGVVGGADPPSSAGVRTAVSSMSKPRVRGSWLVIGFNSCHEGYFLALATRLNNQCTVVPGQLFICVQQLDTINGPVRGNINVHVVADLDRRYLAQLLMESYVCNVIFRIITKLHNDLQSVNDPRLKARGLRIPYRGL